MSKKTARAEIANARWDSRAFGTGEVAKILLIEEWRVKNFALAKAAGLQPSRVVGTQKRRIRVFSMFDVVKLALAKDMTIHGFTVDAVGAAVETLNEARLREWAGAVENGLHIPVEQKEYLWHDREWELIGHKELQKRHARVGNDIWHVSVIDLFRIVQVATKRIMHGEREGHI